MPGSFETQRGGESADSAPAMTIRTAVILSTYV